MGANQKVKNIEQLWCTQFSMETLEHEALTTLQFPPVSNNCAAEVRMEAEEAFSILRRVLPWVGQCTAPQVLL